MRLRLLTPRSFGLRRRSGGKVTCAEGEVMSSDDDSSEDSQDMHTPSKAGRGSPKHGSSVSATSTVSPDLSRTRTQSQQYYCTQACLLELKRGHTLDRNCPNVSSHRVTENGNRHAIGIGIFTVLVWEQRRRTWIETVSHLASKGREGRFSRLLLHRMDTRSSLKGRYLCLCRTCSMRAAYTKDWRP
jgi:hypothetical protein